MLALGVGRLAVDIRNDVALAALVAEPHIVVDRVQLFLHILRRSQILIVGCLVELAHRVAAIGARTRMIAQTFHLPDAEQIGRKWHPKPHECKEEKHRTPVVQHPVARLVILSAAGENHPHHPYQGTDSGHQSTIEHESEEVGIIIVGCGVGIFGADLFGSNRVGHGA